MVTIEYEGTDISSLVSTTRCVYEAREEGRVPQLSVEFEDDQGLWDSWQPQPGDRISVAAPGAAGTGALFVKACAPAATGYTILADALPVSDTPAVRAWGNTTLRVIIEQLSTVLGLVAAFHGVEDMAFSYVRQDGEGALPVLARACAYAGCTFDVYDGVLHAYSRSWAEAQEPVAALEIAADSNYEYRRLPLYTSCRLAQTEIAGVRPGFSAGCGESGRELAMTLDDRIGFPGTSELERACAGVLSCANARLSLGHAESSSLSPFTPGCVCSISCAKIPSLAGHAIVTRVRNDFSSGRSKVWWR